MRSVHGLGTEDEERIVAAIREGLYPNEGKGHVTFETLYTALSDIALVLDIKVEPDYELPIASMIAVGNAFAIIDSIQKILWVEDNTVNPEKKWNSVTAGAIANVLSGMGLGPREVK